MADIREDAREPLQLLREKLAHDEDGWAALCQLMPMLAAAPPPAAAEPKTLPVPTRVYLTDKAAVIVGDPQRGWDEEGPEAHNCDDMGCATIGPHVLARVPFTDERDLAQQPAADPRSTHRVWRGDDWQPCYCEATDDHRIGSEQPAAVDEAMVERACRHWYTQWDTADRGTKRVWAKTMYDLLTAALATQHQEPTT